MLVRTFKTIQSRGRRNKSFATRRLRKPTKYFMVKRFYAQPKSDRKTEIPIKGKNEDKDMKKKGMGQDSKMGKGNEDRDKQVDYYNSLGRENYDKKDWNPNLEKSKEDLEKNGRKINSMGENMDRKGYDKGSTLFNEDNEKQALSEGQGFHMGRGKENLERSERIEGGAYDTIQKAKEKAKEFIESPLQETPSEKNKSSKSSSGKENMTGKKGENKEWNFNGYTGVGTFKNTDSKDVETSRFAKMTTMVGTQTNFVDAMRSLIELEYDAVEAYKACIDKLSSDKFKKKMTEFLNDHNRHIKELKELMDKNGEKAPEGPDMKQYLTKGKVFMAQVGGDLSILNAMLSNEGETNVAYERMVNYEGIWQGGKDILQRAFEDEKKHASWIKKILNENKD